MKILMLVNWKITYCSTNPTNKQPPDYYLHNSNNPYWFYKYFKFQPDVDVIDISSYSWLENIEKNKLRFYVWQTLKAIPKSGKYDLIVSHGMQSGVVLSLIRRFLKTKAKHIVFDIGSFNSAAESGFALKLMQFASKSIDGIIYHTSSQKEYYGKFFPWILNKSHFIRFGTDLDFFNPSELKESDDHGEYIICVGYAKRDWATLVAAYQKLNTSVKLRLVGHVEERFNGLKQIEQIAFIPIKDLIKQIYNALFCVLPLESFNYSYGQMTLMQQMALGKCVITANVPSLVDYVQDGETAVLYESGNLSDLARKMEFILGHPDTRAAIGAAGRTYLMDKCNEKTMALSVETFYNQILGNRQTPDIRDVI